MEKLIDKNIQIGDVFTIKLPNGTYGIFHVAQSSPFPDKKSPNTKGFVIACLDWFSNKLPTLNQVYKPKVPFFNLLRGLPPVLVRKSIYKDSIFKKKQKCFIYVPYIYKDAETYQIFITKLGNVPSPYPPFQLGGLALARFNHVQFQLEYQWRYRNDLENLKADWEILNKARKRQLQKVESAFVAEFTKKPINELLTTKTFQGWKRTQGTKIALAAEKIWVDGLKKIIKLQNQSNRTKDSLLEEIKNMIHAYNDLNADHNDTFETVEREELYQEFRKLALSLKIEKSTLDEVFDSIRQW